MLATWRNTCDLAVERLDPGFYAPRFIACVEAITSQGRRTLKSISEKVVDHSFLHVRTEDYVPTGIPFVRVTDLGDMLLKTDKLIYITEEAHKREANTIFRPGDLLVSKTGKVAVSIVPPSIPECNTSQDVMGVVVKPNIDPYYLTAFLGSESGICQQQRWVQGPVQPHLSLGNLRRLFIFMPDPAIQRAIGNKVRKAERLRELATYWTGMAHAKMDEQPVDFGKDPAQSNWIALRDLNSRLDTQPYRTHFLSLHKALHGSSAAPLFKLAVVSGGDPVSSDEFGGQGVPLVRIRDIQPTGFADPDVRVSESYFASKPQCAAKSGRIVMGMDGEFRAQFFIESDLPRLINQRVAIIDCKTIRPELLVAWLNRAEGQMQLARWAVQTTVAHTSLSDIRELLIPRLADDEEEGLADAFLQARKANAEAVLLIDATRAGVEALIDGTLDEPTLLAEGEAIDQWLAENPSPHVTNQ